MTKLKAILAAIGTVALLILGAFGLGSMRGREKAEAKADNSAPTIMLQPPRQPQNVESK